MEVDDIIKLHQQVKSYAIGYCFLHTLFIFMGFYMIKSGDVWWGIAISIINSIGLITQANVYFNTRDKINAIQTNNR